MRWPVLYSINSSKNGAEVICKLREGCEHKSPDPGSRPSTN